MSEQELKKTRSGSESIILKLNKWSPTKIAKFIPRNNPLLKEEIDRKREEKERHHRPATADAAVSYSKKKPHLSMALNDEPVSAQTTHFVSSNPSFAKNTSLKVLFQATSNISSKKSSILFESLGLNKVEEHQKIIDTNQVMMASALHKHHKTLSRYNLQFLEGNRENTIAKPVESLRLNSKESSINIHVMQKKRSMPISPMTNIAFFNGHRRLTSKTSLSKKTAMPEFESVITPK